MNLFATLQTAMFRTVESVYGDIGVWNGEEIKGLIRQPTIKEKEEWGDMEYSHSELVFEYYADRWQGLAALANGNDMPEISINGTVYIARQVHTKYDGKTLLAKLEPK